MPCSNEGCDCPGFRPQNLCTNKCRLCFHSDRQHGIISTAVPSIIPKPTPAIVKPTASNASNASGPAKAKPDCPCGQPYKGEQFCEECGYNFKTSTPFRGSPSSSSAAPVSSSSNSFASTSSSSSGCSPSTTAPSPLLAATTASAFTFQKQKSLEAPLLRGRVCVCGETLPEDAAFCDQCGVKTDGSFVRTLLGSDKKQMPPERNSSPMNTPTQKDKPDRLILQFQLRDQLLSVPVARDSSLASLLNKLSKAFNTEVQSLGVEGGVSTIREEDLEKLLLSANDSTVFTCQPKAGAVPVQRPVVKLFTPPQVVPPSLPPALPPVPAMAPPPLIRTRSPSPRRNRAEDIAQLHRLEKELQQAIAEQHFEKCPELQAQIAALQAVLKEDKADKPEAKAAAPRVDRAKSPILAAKAPSVAVIPALSLGNANAQPALAASRSPVLAAKAPASASPPPLSLDSQPVELFGSSLAAALMGTRMAVPYVCYACLSHLQDWLDTEGLFRVNGSSAQIQQLQAAFSGGTGVESKLAQNKALDAVEPHAVAGLLKKYIRELDPPLIPFNQIDSFLAVLQEAGKDAQYRRLAALVRGLGPPERGLVSYVLHFMHKSLSPHSDKNKMTFTNIGVVLGPCLLRRGPDTEPNALRKLMEPAISRLIPHEQPSALATAQEMKDAATVIALMIEGYDTVFPTGKTSWAQDPPMPEEPYNWDDSHSNDAFGKMKQTGEAMIEYLSTGLGESRKMFSRLAGGPAASPANDGGDKILVTFELGTKTKMFRVPPKAKVMPLVAKVSQAFGVEAVTLGFVDGAGRRKNITTDEALEHYLAANPEHCVIVCNIFFDD